MTCLTDHDSYNYIDTPKTVIRWPRGSAEGAFLEDAIYTLANRQRGEIWPTCTIFHLMLHGRDSERAYDELYRLYFEKAKTQHILIDEPGPVACQ